MLIFVQSLWTRSTDNVVGGSPLICCCYPLISDRALSGVDSYCPVWHHVYLKGGYGLLVHCLCVFSGDDVNLSLRRISTESTAVRVCVGFIIVSVLAGVTRCVASGKNYCVTLPCVIDLSCRGRELEIAICLSEQGRAYVCSVSEAFQRCENCGVGKAASRPSCGWNSNRW